MNLFISFTLKSWKSNLSFSIVAIDITVRRWIRVRNFCLDIGNPEHLIPISNVGTFKLKISQLSLQNKIEMNA